MAWTPGTATASVFACLILNAIIGAVFFLLFELFRNYNVEVYAPRLRTSKSLVIAKPVTGVLGWFKQVWEVSDADTLRMIGLDGYVFLRYLKMCAKIAGICCPFLVILLPVYYTAAGGEGVYGINLLSMANIPANGDRLWACLIFAYIFSFVFLYFIYREYEHFSAMRVEYLKHGGEGASPQKTHTVLVENIPKEFQTSQKLAEFFDSIFPGQVQCCNIAVYAHAVDVLVAKRAKAVAGLEQMIAKMEAHPEKERPLIKLKKGKVAMCGGDEEVDGITFMTQQVAQLNAEVAHMQAVAIAAEDGVQSDFDQVVPSASKSTNPTTDTIGLVMPMEGAEEDGRKSADETSAFIAEGTGVELQTVDSKQKEEKGSQKTVNVTSSVASSDKEAQAAAKALATIKATPSGFVTFKSAAAQTVACQVPILTEEFPTMTAVPSASPEDIIWDNIGALPQSTRRIAWITSVIYKVGLGFWGVIMAFIAAVSNLSNLETYLPFLADLDPVSYAILEGQLPVVILMVFMMLIPITMTAVAKHVEKRKTNSAVQLEVFKWYFMYNLANVYLILLAGSIFDSLAEAIAEPTSIVTLIGKALPSVSIFFLNYTITNVLSGVPSMMLRLVNVIIFRLYRLIFKPAALTRRVLVEGPLADSSVNYGTTLPNYMYILCITLLYWVISPIQLVVSFFFFGGSYMAWKYQYLYVIERDFESGGMFFYGLYHNSMVSLMAGTIGLIVLMGIKKGIVVTILLIPLVLAIVYAWRHTENKFKPLSLNLPYNAAVKKDVASKEQARLSSRLSGSRRVAPKPQLQSPDRVEGGNDSAAAAVEEQEDIEVCHAESFTADFNKPASIADTVPAFPYPYRINDTPLLTEAGELNAVYHEALPNGQDMSLQDFQTIMPQTSDEGKESGKWSP